MAAKKRRVSKRRKPRIHRLGRYVPARTLDEYNWRIWNHDLDAILHEMVKNPAVFDVDPVALVERAAAFADALRALQEKRRPASVPPDFRA
jgi:hypothetical protein